ncbi:MAG: deoxyribonuclease V [Candidatus Eisenbacteria bacterium]|nr:deoxyribonuclease V [Candidatus Latescibacterota bacterium]MBD3301613.1 deoxyribonuclease V [Candidatus Eisenbacteria bacterium]
MRIRQLHGWALDPAEARGIQDRLRGRVLSRPLDWKRLRLVAGCDAAIAGAELHAAVVVLALPSLEVVERREGSAPLRFPYVPGLLSFREIPALLAAFGALHRRPDAVLCDGQGIAHPRRLGLASHLGLILDLPCVGVAKSRLVGEAREPGPRRGSATRLVDRGEVVGRLLRTRDRVRPVYVSIGHRITLPDAVRLVLRCGAGYRLPEPTRLADRWVGLRARERRQAVRSDAID